MTAARHHACQGAGPGLVLVGELHQDMTYLRVASPRELRHVLTSAGGRSPARLVNRHGISVAHTYNQTTAHAVNHFTAKRATCSLVLDHVTPLCDAPMRCSNVMPCDARLSAERHRKQSQSAPMRTLLATSGKNRSPRSLGVSRPSAPGRGAVGRWTREDCQAGAMTTSRTQILKNQRASRYVLETERAVG